MWFYFDFFKSYMYGCLIACVSVHGMHVIPVEVRRRTGPSGTGAIDRWLMSHDVRGAGNLTLVF